jgi:hypothetical protein
MSFTDKNGRIRNTLKKD